MKFAETFQTALVEYDEASANAAIAALRVLPEVKGPGLSQSDAIQVVTQLSILRNQIVDVGRFALITERGQLSSVVSVVGDSPKLAQRVEDWARAGGVVIPIVGGDDLRTPVPPGVGLPSDWGNRLALSLDQVMAMIADAERGPNVPIGFSDIRGSLAIALPVIAVIVAGIGVATVAAVAAWRYLDPDARVAITTVREAGQNYRDRVKVFRETKKMPPPSQVEIDAERLVAQLSSKRKNHDWLYGAGIGGGVTAFVLAAAYIGSIRR